MDRLAANGPPVLVLRLSRTGVNDLHPVQRNLQLLCGDLGLSGVGSLPHFRFGNQEADAITWQHLNPRQRVELPLGKRKASRHRRRELSPEGGQGDQNPHGNATAGHAQSDHNMPEFHGWSMPPLKPVASSLTSMI